MPTAFRMGTRPPIDSYCRDTFGRLVLVGLTYAETQEFEKLDARPPVDEDGNHLPFPDEGDSMSSQGTRWLELYEKHRAACTRE